MRKNKCGFYFVHFYIPLKLISGYATVSTAHSVLLSPKNDSELLASSAAHRRSFERTFQTVAAAAVVETRVHVYTAVYSNCPSDGYAMDLLVSVKMLTRSVQRAFSILCFTSSCEQNETRLLALCLTRVP